MFNGLSQPGAPRRPIFEGQLGSEEGAEAGEVSEAVPIRPGMAVKGGQDRWPGGLGWIVWAEGSHGKVLSLGEVC